MALACRATGVELMVRILKTGYTSPIRVLESGANGTTEPHCRSAEEARKWVDWIRFPPLGRLGFDGAGADSNYALANANEHLNSEVFLVLQIEDREAVDCVDEIAAVEGVDLLFVSPADLSISYGVPMQRDHPLVQRALDKVANAASRAGKWWGTVTRTPEAGQIELDRGARMVTCVNDHFLLVDGLQKAYRDFAHIGIHEVVPELSGRGK